MSQILTCTSRFNQEDSLVGCLLGTAIGDAMGLSYEGLSKRRLYKLYPCQDKYHFFFGKGMVSDDTEHTCMVAQALIATHGNIEKFAHNLAWRLRFWLLGLPAGIGFATLRAIIKLYLGFSPHHSGVFSAGNGAAMRIAIVGVCYGEDKSKLRQWVKVTTQMTHTDPKAELGALAVALAAYLASRQTEVTPLIYFAELKELLKNDSATEFLQLMQETLDSVSSGQMIDRFADAIGLTQGVSGYIYHTVPIVIHTWLNNQTDYPRAIHQIISLGGDTDTTAAIVGGIIGARVGKTGIPSPWQNNLWEFPRTVQWLEELGKRLNQVCFHGIQQKPVPISIIGILLRNLLFMVLVLAHGFRRLLPPYAKR
jgi:ADP-ribosyl-[dinitrogen reductase] hydrolase